MFPPAPYMVPPRPRPGEPLSCTPLAPGRGAGRNFYHHQDPTIRLERPSGLWRCVNGEAEGQRPPAKRPRTETAGPGEILRTENETVNNGDGKTKAEKRPDHARPARPEGLKGEVQADRELLDREGQEAQGHAAGQATECERPDLPRDAEEQIGHPGIQGLTRDGTTMVERKYSLPQGATTREIVMSGLCPSVSARSIEVQV